jgi:hypothetical protein
MNEPDGAADLAIDAAVMNWRAGVRGLEGRELDELTDHVASSARTLMANNLAADEAVLIATRRLGAERELVREFERGDGRLRQFDPLALLLVGAAAALVIGPLARLPMYVSAVAGKLLGYDHSQWATPMTTIAAIAPIAILIPLVRWRGAADAVARVARRPFLALTFALVFFCLPKLAQIGVHHVLTHDEYGRALAFGWPSATAFFAFGLVAPLVMLAFGLRRSRRLASE